jgi:recombination DNA repair RAD52 pathway protein
MTHTPLDTFQLQMLHANLHHARVANRQQGGRRLAYVEAWDIKAMLIRVFGYGGFSSDVIDARIMHETTYPSPTDESKMLWRVGAMCTLRLTIHQTGATYTETAVSSQSNPEWGEAADFAIKTAESDALKRAAINLGTQFGLSLYDGGSLRDVVRKVVAPAQRQTVDDLNAIVGGDDAAREAARTRLQASLNVAPRVTANGDAVGESPREAETEAEALVEATPAARAQAHADAIAAKRSRPAKDRQKAAQAALAAAEAATGVTNPATTVTAAPSADAEDQEHAL